MEGDVSGGQVSAGGSGKHSRHAAHTHCTGRGSICAAARQALCPGCSSYISRQLKCRKAAPRLQTVIQPLTDARLLRRGPILAVRAWWGRCRARGGDMRVDDGWTMGGMS